MAENKLGKEKKMEKLNNLQTVKKAMELSSKFESKINEWIQDDAMLLQQEYSKEVNPDGLKYHDHYCSFFYTIENLNDFLESMASNESIYSEDAAALLPELEKLEEAETNDDITAGQYQEMENQLKEKAQEILSRYENDLKYYENPDQYFIDESIQNMIDNDMLENYYIDGSQVKLYHPAMAAYYETI